MRWQRLWSWGRDPRTNLEGDRGTPDGGLPLEGPAPLAGETRHVQQLRGVLGMAAVPVAVAGVLRQAAARLRSTGLVLAYRASPVRALRPRLLGAALTSLVVVAGGVKVAPRLRAQLTVRQPVAGRLEAAPRLQGQLTSTVALAGRIRLTPRLTGALSGTSGTPVALAGQTVATPARLRATGFVLGYRATPLHGGARLTAQLTSHVALAGTLRGGAARTSNNIVPPVYVSLAGRTAASPARLRATGFVLGYRAAPVRDVVRLRGVLTTPSTGTLAAVVRGTGRLPAALLTTTYPAAEVAGAIPRLRGSLIQKRLLQGTIREINLRLTARIDKTPVRGLSIVGAPRVRAVLTQARPLAGTIRQALRLRGAGFQLQLQGRTAAAGSTLGALTQRQPLGSRLRATPARCTGAGRAYIRVPVALAGVGRASPARLRAALGNTTGTGYVLAVHARDRYLVAVSAGDQLTAEATASDLDECVATTEGRDRYTVRVTAHDLVAMTLTLTEDA